MQGSDYRRGTVLALGLGFAVCVAGLCWADGPAGTEAAGASRRGGDAGSPVVRIYDSTGEVDFSYELTDWLQPQAPVIPPSDITGIATPGSADEMVQTVFASDEVRRNLIAEYRRRSLPAAGTELVFGSEGRFRVTTDAGNLLGKSFYTPSVKVQQRTPNVSEPRIRGSKSGRLLASGSYWAPARDDLDTALSKIDSSTIRDIVVIKGPYTTRLGPGFYFVDFQFADTPRSACGYEWSGSNALEYQTNGEQLFGRQTVQGGAENYGYRISYGHRTGNDYDTGAGWSLPTSYNSRYLDAAFGYDFTPGSRLEFNYLRVDQTGVEFPGMVFDINWLGTDGYELRYTLEDQPEFDRLTLEGWYNRTRFYGDTSRAGKNRQIPSLRDNFGLAPDQYLNTDVDGMSAGYRLAVTWGDPNEAALTVGTDLIRVGQQLNDVVPEHVDTLPPPLPPLSVTVPSINYPIPRSQSVDVGVFAEHERRIGDSLAMRIGSRVDIASTDSRDAVTGMGLIAPGFPSAQLVELPLSVLKEAQLEQNFVPWAVFATADYDINDCWTAFGGAGYAMRVPTLTELYAAGPFIGSLQPGLTFLEGDPELDPERLVQLDLGLRADLGSTRLSASGFFAWVFDYITYDDVGVLHQPQPPARSFQPGVDLQQAAYVNTDRATLAGFEFAGEQDITSWLTGFSLVSYVEGRDHTRSKPSRIGAVIREREGFDPNTPRSFNGTVESEPLPGIPPLEARLGLRVKDPACERWAIELEARVVDNQDRVAATLFERPTPDFTVWNVRGYWRPYERLTLYGGVENLGDRFYREHLDYRSGRGVYQPGISFYMLTELVY